MKIKYGVYANCSEWNEEVGSSYEKDQDISPADEEYFRMIEEEVKEELKVKEWD